MKTMDSDGLMPAAGLLPTELDALHRDGFAVVPGPMARGEVQALADAYDKAMREADPRDTRRGSTTTRVDDLVNRAPDFDCIYVHPPLLDACWRVFRQPFKLSTMLARTLWPGSPPQKLHQDFPRDEAGWTMVGFILMVDDFRIDNGATCFLPGSHHWPSAEIDNVARSGAVPACGPGGSMIVYNGSVWHGHGPNGTLSARRSIQGAFIRRDLTSGFDLASRMRMETLLRIGPVARHLILAELDV